MSASTTPSFRSRATGTASTARSSSWRLPEAMRVLTDQAETGAVTICLPQDVQAEGYDYPANFFAKRVYHISRAVPARRLARAVELIATRRSRSSSPVAGSSTPKRRPRCPTSPTAGIPVRETQAGKGALPWNHAWNAGRDRPNGSLAANRLAREADLVIAVGTRLATSPPPRTRVPESRRALPQHQCLIARRPQVRRPAAGRGRAVDSRRAAGRALRAARHDAGHYAESRGLKAEWDATVDGILAVGIRPICTQANVIGVVNAASGPRDVVVCAAGGLPGDLLKLWRPVDPKAYHLEYGYSTMGYEIAGGLGVKMADPSREVYVMVGDGSYLMLHTEIVTSLQEGMKLTIVVVHNHGYASIGDVCRRRSGSQRFGTHYRARNPETRQLDGPLLPVDLAANAASLGAQVERADARGPRGRPAPGARLGSHHRRARGDRPAGARPGFRVVVGRARVRGLRARLHPRRAGDLRRAQAHAAPLRDMSVGVGVIGAGMMGAAHVATLTTAVAGAHVAAVSDADPERAAAAAGKGGARAMADPPGADRRPGRGRRRGRLLRHDPRGVRARVHRRRQAGVVRESRLRPPSPTAARWSTRRPRWRCGTRWYRSVSCAATTPATSRTQAAPRRTAASVARTTARPLRRTAT